MESRNASIGLLYPLWSDSETPLYSLCREDQTLTREDRDKMDWLHFLRYTNTHRASAKKKNNMKKALVIVMLLSLSLRTLAYFNGSVTCSSGQTLWYVYFTNPNVAYIVAPVESLGYGGTNYYSNNNGNYPIPTGNLIIPSTISHSYYVCSVTEISNHAFYGCTGLTGVSFPSSLQKIRTTAFQNCSGLTSVVIPESVNTIESQAFAYCTGLTAITINSNSLNINANAFYACHNIATFNYNIGQPVVVNLPNKAGVTTLTFGNNVQTIPSFANYTGITSLVIPDNVVSISSEAFLNCTSLNSVTLPNSITTLPSGLFKNCSSLTSIVIPSTVTSIGDNAFEGCTSLESIVIPNSVTHIGANAFKGCTNLSSVTISNSATTISDNAFYGCTSLASISVPNSVTTIGNSVFAGCTSLASVTLSNSLNTIGNMAFQGNTSLTSIVIPASVTQIGHSAFSGCINLSSINIPAMVTTLSSSLFAGCSSLTSLPISNTCTTIQDGAFSGCTGLTSIVIPESVTMIGNQAFYNCSNLTVAYFTGSVPPSLGNNALSNNVSIGIPCGTYYNYFYAWGNRNYLEPDPVIVLTISANNSSWGDASCIQVPPMYSDVRCDSTAVIQATANYGYHFDHWSTGSTQSLDTVHLTGDCTITAYFAKNQYTVTGTTNQNERGSVTGSATVNYLDNVTLTATAYYGYHFSHWSDGNTENPHQVTATQNQTVYAYFEPNQYALNVESADGTMGYVSGSGNFDYLSNRTIIATANYGHHFVQWNDGMATSSRTITLTQDTSFTAYFAANQYTLTVVSADEAMGSVSGGGTFDYGNTVTISANPTEHYHFVRWNDGNTDNPRDIEITQDRTLTAFFAIDTHHVDITSGDITRGSVTGGGDFEYGTAITISATAYSGYQFVRWSNGVSYNPYTFAVTTDMELTAVFIEEGTVYNISVTANDPAAGTVSGGGPYGVGEEAVLTAIANSGYQFDHWEDGSYQNPRTVTVTADASYVAYFVPTQSISDVQDAEALIYARGGRIIVENVNEMVVRVYDMMGRLVATASGETISVPMPVGVYLVKVGTLPARKVVVIR